MSWIDSLRYDAIRPLSDSRHPAIEYHAKRDLLNIKVESPKATLWDLPIPRKILKRQNANGSWTYPGKTARSVVDYDLLETYRQLGFLVEMFGFTREHPAIEQAAAYVFSKQSSEGDIRGIYGNQYSPNYTAALVELLVKAGYGEDKRILKAFEWLISDRQTDGGWALPLRTLGRNLDALEDEQTLQSDLTKPFSHLVTGVVLRAFAAHDQYCKSSTATHAANLLASRFFERDVYPDKNRVDDWTRFSFPFWMTDIVSSLSSISLIEPDITSDKVLQAKSWLIAHQQPDGLFTGHLLKDRYHDLQLWYSLAVCRVFSRIQ